MLYNAIAILSIEQYIAYSIQFGSVERLEYPTFRTKFVAPHLLFPNNKIHCLKSFWKDLAIWASGKGANNGVNGV